MPLHILTFVRYLKSDSPGETGSAGGVYAFSSVFQPQVYAEHPNFEAGLEAFDRALDDWFDTHSKADDYAELRRWLLFNPETQLQRIPLQNDTKPYRFNGTFSYLQFELSGHAFGVFPAFGESPFYIDPNSDLKKQQEAEIIDYLRFLSEEADRPVTAEDYYHTRRDRLLLLPPPAAIASRIKTPIGTHSNEDKAPDTLQEGARQLNLVSTRWLFRPDDQTHRAVGREQQAQHLAEMLHHPTPIALTGPLGSGRRTLLREAQHQFEQRQNELPEAFRKSFQIFVLDPNKLIAGMSVSGAWESRLTQILDYVASTQNTNTEVRLLIDNPIALLRIGTSASSSLVIKDVLRPYLEQKKLSLLLIATPKEWQIIQDKDPGLSNLFRTVPVAPASLEESYHMVLHRRRLLESQTSISFPIDAIRQLYLLHQRYLSTETLPGSIIHLMEELSSLPEHTGEGTDLEQLFLKSRGIEAAIFKDPSPLDAQALLKEIQARLIGQPEAAQALANVVQLIRARMNNRNRPLATLLFIGPSGVGKTEGAKILSQLLHDRPDRLLRLDMNEYNDGYAVSRLIGDFQQPEGVLTRLVRQQAFGVLLLDEIDKAHPAVLDLLLQILDDARLSDGIGRVADFSNLVIIMTSNQGAQDIDRQIRLGSSESDIRLLYQRAVENTLRPELVNRIEQIVAFRPLEKEDIMAIARLQIQSLLRRDGFARRHTSVDISTEALEWVATRGYNRKQGGRELKRQIERDITSAAAGLLLQHPNEPLIWMKISLQGERLVPEISSFSPLPQTAENWIPTLPSGKQQGAFLKRLIFLLSDLRSDLSDAHPPSDEPLNLRPESQNWQYFHLMQQLDSLLDLLRIRSMKLPLPPEEMLVKQPLRLHQRRLSPEADTQLFTELHELGEPILNRDQTELLHLYLNSALLWICGDQYLEAGSGQTLHIQIESGLESIGQEQVNYLSQLYLELLNEYAQPDWQRPADAKKPTAHITVQAPGMAALLAGEVGVHLFQTRLHPSIPIRVRLKIGNQQQQSNQVIRYYARNMAQDLRTGLIGELPQPRHSASGSPAERPRPEFRLLLYAGIPAPHRALPEKRVLT